MLRPAIVCTGALMLLVLPSCGSDGGSSPPAPLDGTSWRMTTVGDADALPGGMLSFNSGKLAGATGCNSFGGTYKQSDDSLTITLGPTTRIGCPPSLDAQERAVLQALPATAAFTEHDGTLTLVDGSGATLLTYTRLSASALVGVTWEVTGINTGTAVSSPVLGSKVTATFGEDGRVTGTAGCNTYTTGYTLDGDTLAIDLVASTSMYCNSPDGVMEQEAAFLEALKRSSTVEAAATGFTLRDAGGSIQLTLSEPA
jgi:heat shock protein HslJ